MENELMETGEVELYGVDFTPSIITINGYEELESTIKGYADKYRGLIFEEENIADAKAIRAEMNNVIKSLDNKRKEVKKAYNKPLNDFENQIKELLNKIKEVNEPIDAGIKEVELKQRDDKRKEIEKQIDERLKEESDYVKKEFSYDSRWPNKTYTMKKIADEVEAQITALVAEEAQIKANQDIITNYCEAVSVEPHGWVSLLNTGHTAPEVMKMIDNSLKEEKARKQAELDRKAKLEEELAYKTEQQRIKEESYVETSVKSLEDPLSFMEDDLDFLNESPFESPEVEQAKPYTVTLELTGTMEQLEKLNGYIKQLGLKVTAS
ncbi:MAG: DUF1351 domain-containing protein [Carnobacterium sp.]|uniref:DUF1351 domain-containing protein n=1 Tax=Carnobacterium sp. TaxID=48221 RepID=UPI003C76491F